MGFMDLRDSSLLRRKQCPIVNSYRYFDVAYCLHRLFSGLLNPEDEVIMLLRNVDSYLRVYAA